MHRSGRSALNLIAPVMIVAAVMSACGDDDDEASTADLSATEQGPSSDEAIEIVAVDYRFEGLPDRIDAGTTLTMRNDSDHEIHEFVAFQIPPEETRTAEVLVALPQSELFASIPGEPAMVLVAPPGDESTVILGDGTLAPGRYLVACAIPTGADPDEFMRQAQSSQAGPPNVPGGPPHFTAGMFAELVVE
jgi:hypothetical protein